MAKKFLLDTNICIHLLRGKYNVDKMIDSVGLEDCYISEITVAELKYGAELGRKKGLKDRQMNLDKFIASIHVLPITGALDLFATEKVRLRLAGTPAEDNFDLLIGCSAISHGMIMVTENLKDFKNLSNIQLENWIER
ncbi:type II toxin-antitoxin system VapC family toxin [uncultured Bacteroides sp.]|uniref:type II toxin-antitoxin system VapC family toxin n=1 Tax=uncultured Bacteroides sp. TaxID=162156 RepID=UPI0025FF87CC|nr:type II toxin-antitoxin system VapC family toxin [uncultured Bacteroides sp.]